MALLLYLYFTQRGPSQWIVFGVASPSSCFAGIVGTRPHPTMVEKSHARLGCGSCFYLVSYAVFCFCFVFSRWLWKLASIIISALMFRTESGNLHTKQKKSREFYQQWPNYALAKILKEASVTKEKNDKVTKMKVGPKQTTKSQE